MSYTKTKTTKRIILISLILIFVITTLNLTDTFYNFENIESISSDNDTKNDLNTADVAFIFDGMYIENIYTDVGGSYPSRFSYVYSSGSLFNETWEIMELSITWVVDSQTRLMSGGSVFGDGAHTPAWIFTDVSLSDTVPIATDGEGDHLFNVAGELIYDLPGFGLVNVWVLEDLTLPGGVAWYEKSTGILFNGTFYYAGGAGWYTFDFIDTNAIVLDHDLKVSLEVPTTPEINNPYIINATVTNTGDNDEINVDLLLYLDDVLEDSITISSLPVGASETINYMWTSTEYETYNFTAYAPPIPGETHIGDNIATELITIGYLQNYTMTIEAPYTWIDASGGTELLLGDDGYATIALPFSFTFYDVAYSTIYLGANGYLSFTDMAPGQYINVPFPSADPTHTYMIAPFWNDILPPAGGHIYYQSFGTYWVAEWLDIYHISGPTLLGSFQVVLYDTGEIIFNYDYLDYIDPYNGYTCGLNLGVDTDYYNSYQGLNDLTDDFSILFTYSVLPGDFILSSNAGTPDGDGNFSLTWDSSSRANNYTVYQYSGLITEINGSLTVLIDETGVLTLPLTGYTNGTYYFIVVAHNDIGDTLSNCIEVVVEIPPEPEPEPEPFVIPGYNLYFIFAAIGIVSAITIRKRRKKRSEY